jgi:hypothetical protein
MVAPQVPEVSQVVANCTCSASSTTREARKTSKRTTPPSSPKSAITPGRISSLSAINASRSVMTSVSV